MLDMSYRSIHLLCLPNFDALLFTQLYCSCLDAPNTDLTHMYRCRYVTCRSPHDLVSDREPIQRPREKVHAQAFAGSFLS